MMVFLGVWAQVGLLPSGWKGLSVLKHSDESYAVLMTSRGTASVRM